MDYMFENSHWTELFSAGEFSLMSYLYGSPSGRERSGAVFGTWHKNSDGTFTQKYSKSALDNKFNNMDLYAMGFLSESELAERGEMYVLGDLTLLEESVTQGIYSAGFYQELTLNDFKNMLLQRENCEGVTPGTYFEGDGSRQNHSYDNGQNFADAFNVGIALIKHPEQVLSQEQAYAICRVVNYELPEYWLDATEGQSHMTTSLPTHGDTNPDCEALFSEN